VPLPEQQFEAPKIFLEQVPHARRRTVRLARVRLLMRRRRSQVKRDQRVSEFSRGLALRSSSQLPFERRRRRHGTCLSVGALSSGNWRTAIDALRHLTGACGSSETLVAEEFAQLLSSRRAAIAPA
jgi:hypothetical protein